VNRAQRRPTRIRLHSGTTLALEFVSAVAIVLAFRAFGAPDGRFFAFVAGLDGMIGLAAVRRRYVELTADRLIVSSALEGPISIERGDVRKIEVRAVFPGAIGLIAVVLRHDAPPVRIPALQGLRCADGGAERPAPIASLRRSRFESTVSQLAGSLGVEWTRS